jgi:1-acyl-sn-glycerol-3-phosphate acyltransferase
MSTEEVLSEDDFLVEAAKRRGSRTRLVGGLDGGASGVGIGRQVARWALGVGRIVVSMVEGRLGGVTGDMEAGARRLSELCRRLAEDTGVEVVVDGRVPTSGLIVANHLGFLDIIALAAAGPCVFVAKRDVSRWLLVGEVAMQSGTVFVDRERRSGVAMAAAGMRRALEVGVRVVVFPEGTSSEGDSVLPFHSSLLQAALDVRVAITPCGIVYRDSHGNPLRDVTYSGHRSLVQSLRALVSRRMTRVHLAFGSPFHAEVSRAELAVDLRDRVSVLIRSGGLRRR